MGGNALHRPAGDRVWKVETGYDQAVATAPKSDNAIQTMNYRQLNHAYCYVPEHALLLYT